MDIIRNAFSVLSKLAFDTQEAGLELNILDNYTNLVNSAKYADSNSTSEPLEKLFKAMSMDEQSQVHIDNKEALIKIQSPKEIEQESPFNTLVKTCDELEAHLERTGQPNFKDRLTKHVQLVKDIEKENFMPAQPVFDRDKFGKLGGTNYKMAWFPIPRIVFAALHNNNFGDLELEGPLNLDNYKRRFHMLLWVEEAHHSIEMHRYDIEGAMLGKHDHGFLVLPVPGLAEGRPSLMRGDRIFLRSEKRSTKYEGFIAEVRERDIFIKLHESLHGANLDGLKFDVTFMESRTPYRRAHQGLHTVMDVRILRDAIFSGAPARENTANPKIMLEKFEPQHLKCFTADLNEYQRMAVLNILTSTCRPAPYIIFGPPGTGKSLTVVEAILQVYVRFPGSKILVVANSNAAVDLLAIRVKASKVVPKDELLRVSAFYRMEKLVPPEISDITMDMDMISYQIYSGCRIVFTTCIQAGALNEFRDRFDYLFMDEAGHANEPESLIPMMLLNNDPTIVLAGDPHQLGPVCMSPIATSHGLATSLLERLSKRAPYTKCIIGDKLAFPPQYISKLVISYRFDPRIMVVNNRRFYDDELICKNETPQTWLDLFNSSSPLIFHHVAGRDRREYNNPSWFNPNEAITCLTYVTRLYMAGMRADQIGLVTPYRRQIDKLNLLMEKCKLPKCKVATMEEFQGDEREVIIISTVRTREKNLKVDKKFGLGFLFNNKRFNVAISRAKWLVVVVGHEKILKYDECWAEFMSKAHKIDTVESNEKSKLQVET